VAAVRVGEAVAMEEEVRAEVREVQ